MSALNLHSTLNIHSVTSMPRCGYIAETLDSVAEPCGFPTGNTAELAEGRGLTRTESGSTQNPEAKGREGLLEAEGVPRISRDLIITIVSPDR